VGRVSNKGFYCDFCHTGNPSHEIPCRDFTVFEWTSVGAWLACDACFDVVQLEDVAHLTRYAIAKYRAQHDDQLSETVEGFLRECYRLFFANRI
jgi:hypothetical protein